MLFTYFLSSLKIRECFPFKVYCKIYRFQDPIGGTVEKNTLYILNDEDLAHNKNVSKSVTMGCPAAGGRDP
jgi:hypothetical protein